MISKSVSPVFSGILPWINYPKDSCFYPKKEADNNYSLVSLPHSWQISHRRIVVSKNSYTHVYKRPFSFRSHLLTGKSLQWQKNIAWTSTSSDFIFMDTHHFFESTTQNAKKLELSFSKQQQSCQYLEEPRQENDCNYFCSFSSVSHWRCLKLFSTSSIGRCWQLQNN